jgi:flavin-dependent dehydrogenase
MLTADALIIGGGPAGLAAAIALRHQGMRTLVVDSATPPVDKACGEGLMPNGVEILKTFGVDMNLERARRFRGIRFISGEDTIEASFPSGFGVGMRRTSLHAQLLAAAERCGVALRWKIKRVIVSEAECRIDDEIIHASYLIGADGQNSIVRRSVGLDRCRYNSFRYGFRQHFRIEPWSEFVEVYWAPDKQIYIAPVGPCEVGVAVLTADPRVRVRQALAGFPVLARRLSECTVSSRELGAVTRNRRLHRVTTARTALIGDASGSVDAITGEGLSLAFRQAQVLAESLSRGVLSFYEQQHTQLFRTSRMMARLLLVLSKNDRLRRRALHATAAQPDLFANLLGFHVGQKSLLEMRTTGLLQFGRSFLTSRSTFE